VNFAERILKMSNLTSEQVDAITYAYMDVKAANKLMNENEEENWDNRIHAEAELYEATNKTKVDLEKAFPFLIEEVGNE